MSWTQSKTFKVVGLSVVGAVASGTALAGGTSTMSSAPSISQQAVTARATGSTEGFQGRTITIRVGEAAAAQTGSSAVAEKRLPIIEIIKRVVSVLGKSFSWLKDQVRRGYSWFVNNVWNKIPSAIRWVISTGWTVYEIFKEIWNYFF